MSSDIHIGPYVIQLDGEQAPAVLDIQTGSRVSMGGAPRWAQFLKQVAQEVTRLRGGSVPAGPDVWERLRVATIQESQLNARLIEIARLVGHDMATMGPISSEAIVRQVELLKRECATLRDEWERSKHFQAQRDGWQERAELAEARVKELEGSASVSDYLIKIKDLESHLRDRDEACENWAKEARELKAQALHMEGLVRATGSLQADLQGARGERDVLIARVKELETERDAIPKGWFPRTQANAYILEIDHLTRERDAACSARDHADEEATRLHGVLTEIGKLINAPPTATLFSEYPQQVQAALERRDETIAAVTRERDLNVGQRDRLEAEIASYGPLKQEHDRIKAQYNSACKDMCEVMQVLGGVCPLEDVAGLVQGLVKERDALKAKLTSTPAPPTQTRAGEIDEALRKIHPGLEASMSDIREMIIEALKVAKVIS